MSSRNGSSIDSTHIPLIITTNEGAIGRQDSGDETLLALSPSTDPESGFKTKSCRSFVRQKNLSNEHRNKSVPYNLQVFCPIPV